MFEKSIENYRVKKVLWMNRWSLLVLRKVLVWYRRCSKPMVESLPAESRWVGGIDAEETLLDNAMRIVDRRIQSASQTDKYKNKSK